MNSVVYPLKDDRAEAGPQVIINVSRTVDGGVDVIYNLVGASRITEKRGTSIILGLVHIKGERESMFVVEMDGRVIGGGRMGARLCRECHGKACKIDEWKKMRGERKNYGG